MTCAVTIAIPARDGAPVLGETLAAVRAQRLDSGSEVELLVCDSGSRDGTVAIARGFDAEVIEIAPRSFSHGGTRNLLMERSAGDHVAFLTQDSVPADDRWLARLLGGFELSSDVALSFGPYRPRLDASPMVARELTEWFRSFSPDGAPRLDRLGPGERDFPARALLGPRGFFTDANGCVARAAWQSVPFRQVSYAEDHVLAQDMLRAGYAKAYLPNAAVIHSHEYSGWRWLKRSFDEARALEQVYGFVEPLDLRTTPLKLWGLVGADWRWVMANRPAQAPWWSYLLDVPLVVRSLRHHALRIGGAVLGSRADGLPEAMARSLSLEGRGHARRSG